MLEKNPVDTFSQLHTLFYISLSMEAYKQLAALTDQLDNFVLTKDHDVWTYIWEVAFIVPEKLINI
jgi:hypothetical protein